MVSVKLFLDNGKTTTVIVDDSTFRDDEYERDLDVYLLRHYRAYEYIDYEIGDTVYMDAERKNRVLALLDAQIKVFETQQLILNEMESVGIDVCANKSEIQLYKSIGIIATALNTAPTVIPFSEDYPDTMEHFIIYKGYKFFQLVDKGEDE